MYTTTVQMNGSDPSSMTQFGTATDCSSVMSHLSLNCTADAGKYAEIVAENERLKVEVTQLKERLAELEQ